MSPAALYAKLRDHFGDAPATCIDVGKLLGFSYSKSYELLTGLVDQGLVKRAKTHDCRVFYRFAVPTVKPAPQVDLSFQSVAPLARAGRTFQSGGPTIRPQMPPTAVTVAEEPMLDLMLKGIVPGVPAPPPTIDRGAALRELRMGLQLEVVHLYYERALKSVIEATPDAATRDALSSILTYRPE